MEVAVIIPCYNEAAAIGKVLDDFKKILPQAKVYVYDNNSNDDTAKVAKKHGAIVRKEPIQGKGAVIRRMFADVEADIYVMTDGDETYDIKRAPELIKILIDENLDMVVGARKEVEEAAYPLGHRWGNVLLTKLVQYFFKHELKDMLSGFRVFSRRFAKTFPCESNDFGIEPEMTVHAFASNIPMREIETDYFARKEGSYSKLHTIKDGMSVLMMIINLVKNEKPIMFFTLISLVFFICSLLIGVPIINYYFETGIVPWIPRSILSMGLMTCFVLCVLAGFILDSQRKSRSENRRLHYLSYKCVAESLANDKK